MWGLKTLMEKKAAVMMIIKNAIADIPHGIKWYICISDRTLYKKKL